MAVATYSARDTPRTVAQSPVLRPDNTRIYYVPREAEDLRSEIVQALQAGPGARFKLTGDAPDAYSGHYIALVIPPARFCGFAQLDLQGCGSSESCPASATACIVKAFQAVPARSLDAFKGLLSNPHPLSVPFGMKVSDLPDKSSITWPYPKSAIEVLNKLWLEAAGSFDSALPHRKRAAVSTTDASRRKAANREMQQERARKIMQEQSNKGWIFGTDVDGQKRTCQFQIFKPRASAPCVIDTDLTRLYNKLALLWREELERSTPKAAKSVAAEPRNTRFQERVVAKQQDMMKAQRFNDIQEQQMKEVVDRAMKPYEDALQEQKLKLQKQQLQLEDQGKKQRQETLRITNTNNLLKQLAQGMLLM